jgi:hypothetical protein
MAEVRTWIIVDDQISEAESFAANFQRSAPTEGYAWKALQAADAQQFLLSDSGDGIAGVLVDVDFSSDGKAIGTGLGLAQNLRAKQKNKKSKTLDYPLIRFANPDPVREFVGDDPASDDLFDLLISKVFARDHLDTVVLQARAARAVYDGLTDSPPADLAAFARFCGKEPAQFEVWGDPRLWQKVRLGLGESSATHVAAGSFFRSFLLPVGLLVDEDTLAIRLGVDIEKSPDWPTLRAALADAKYTGVGAEGFERWWARGIDSFWLGVDDDEYLHQRNSEERVDRLRKISGDRLAALQPPARYWRLCALSLRNGECKAVDPARAVTLVQRSPQEPWIDPEQAAVEVAVMFRDDPRIDTDELARLTK